MRISEDILKTIPTYRPLEKKDWICPKCDRVVPYYISLCSCWTREEMIEAGIDPATHGFRQSRPVVITSSPDCQFSIGVEPPNEAKSFTDDKSDWDIWVGINDELLHLRSRIAQLEGHLAYQQKKLEEHSKGQKYGRDSL